MARIVHISPMYAPARGGVELFFLRLSEHLTARGHDVTVWTTDARVVRGFTSAREPRLTDRETRINGVAVRRFPVRHVPAQRYVRTAAHLLPLGTRWKCDTLRWTPWVPSMTREASRVAGPVDLVHASALPYSSLLFAGIRLAEHCRAKLVISPFTHVAPPGPAGVRMDRAYLSPLNLALLSRADRLFAQTEFERGVLSDAGLSGVDTAVVGLGVDAGACTGGIRERFRGAHQLADDEVVIGHLANKSWDKGTVDLLDAAEQLWGGGCRFRLVLAGSEMPTFTRRWAAVRSRDRVVNLGQLSDEERRDFYAAIDLFVLPSYVESFGLSLLEAGLNGVPLIAYAHGGPLRIFSHDASALLTPAGDVRALAAAIGGLVEREDDRHRLGREAAAVAAEYTWARALGRATAAYEALLR